MKKDMLIDLLSHIKNVKDIPGEWKNREKKWSHVELQPTNFLYSVGNILVIYGSGILRRDHIRLCRCERHQRHSDRQGKCLLPDTQEFLPAWLHFVLDVLLGVLRDAVWISVGHHHLHLRRCADWHHSVRVRTDGFFQHSYTSGHYSDGTQRIRNGKLFHFSRNLSIGSYF